MEMIDLTPTREQYARTLAYIMSSHLKEGIYVFGDYNNYSEHEENVIFTTWENLDAIIKSFDEVGLFFTSALTDAQRNKIVHACLATALNNTKEFTYNK